MVKKVEMITQISKRLHRFSNKLLICVICILICVITKDASSELLQKDYIRVLILKDVESCLLSVRGYFEITSLKTDKSLYKGKNISKNKVSAQEITISIGKLKFNEEGIKIVPRKSGYVYVNPVRNSISNGASERRLRGQLIILKTQDAKLKVINYLDIEDYLRGVLRAEVNNRWPMSVLMAQAIAARTYALYQKNINKLNDFDLTADIYSQVYGGVYQETWSTDKAVKNTKGKVLVFGGELFPTYYHATCAGYTEDASQLWNINIAPLKGVVCNFCAESKHYSWSQQISLKDIELKLKAANIEMEAIKDIIITKRNNSYRVAELKVIDSKRETLLKGKDFRQILDPDVIRSTNFSLELKDGFINFKGYGWGHGVGLCQWGAYAMSKRGFSSEKILKFYYPGTEITNLKYN